MLLSVLSVLTPPHTQLSPLHLRQSPLQTQLLVQLLQDPPHVQFIGHAGQIPPLMISRSPKNDRRNSGCKLQPEWSRIEPIFIWTSHKVFSASFPCQHILDNLFGLAKNTCKLQHAGEYPRPWTVLSPAEATPTVTRRVKRRRRREETAFAIWKQLSAMRSQTMDNAGGK